MTLPVDRANRIADAVEDIEVNVKHLRSYQDLSLPEYQKPENHEIRDAVERKFVKLTETMLDIATEIAKQELENAPDRRKEKIDVLETEGIVSPELADRLRAAVGFRDVLAHAYGPVIEDGIVFDALQNNLDRFVDFVDAIEQYMESY